MRREYIEKLISYEYESLDIGQLIEYLMFLHQHESYLDEENNSHPFEGKPAEVVQFMVKKYGVIDRGIK